MNCQKKLFFLCIFVSNLFGFSIKYKILHIVFFRYLFPPTPISTLRLQQCILAPGPRSAVPRSKATGEHSFKNTQNCTTVFFIKIHQIYFKNTQIISYFGLVGSRSIKRRQCLRIHKTHTCSQTFYTLHTEFTQSCRIHIEYLKAVNNHKEL